MARPTSEETLEGWASPMQRQNVPWEESLALLIVFGVAGELERRMPGTKIFLIEIRFIKFNLPVEWGFNSRRIALAALVRRLLACGPIYLKGLSDTRLQGQERLHADQRASRRTSHLVK